MNILVKWPTRQRPGLFLAALALWRRLTSGRHPVRYLVSTDADDATMQAPAVREALAGWPDVTVAVGPAGRTKIQACNADLPAPSAGPADVAARLGFQPDVLVLASDDMLPQQAGWDDLVAAQMDTWFPALDGALHFNDGYLGQDRLITLSIQGWNLFRRFGYLYHPAYRSFFCDNEFTDVVRRLDQYHYDPRVLIRHAHIGRRPDPLYQRNAGDWAADQATYEQRRAAGFGQSPPLLSLLIASLEKRRALLEGLVHELHRQIFAQADPWAVELRIDRDDGARPIGAKRQALLRRARGRYLCFIDDDDMVAPTYVHDILSALSARPDADCVVFAGRLEVEGRYLGPFDYSLAHRYYHQIGHNYFRTPNHLCPVRRELALAVGFAPLRRGEDTDYARRLYPRLRTEVSIDAAAPPGAPRPAPAPAHTGGARKTLYYYRFSPTGTATQR